MSTKKKPKAKKKPARPRKKPVPGRTQGRPREPAAMSGAALKVAREAAGWSMRALASKLSISAPALFALEAGSANISLKRATRICAIFRRANKVVPECLVMAASS